jgi:hypothetical protein
VGKFVCCGILYSVTKFYGIPGNDISYLVKSSPSNYKHNIPLCFQTKRRYNSFLFPSNTKIFIYFIFMTTYTYFYTVGNLTYIIKFNSLVVSSDVVRGDLRSLPEDCNVMSKHVGATIHD